MKGKTRKNAQQSTFKFLESHQSPDLIMSEQETEKNTFIPAALAPQVSAAWQHVFPSDPMTLLNQTLLGLNKCGCLVIILESQKGLDWRDNKHFYYMEHGSVGL